MKLLDIGEVAEATGLRVSALRYYEEKGLVEALGRKGLRRQYGPEVLQQLALVALGRQAGFSLDEIGGMFGAGGAPALPRAELKTRAAAMRDQARQLEALAQMLGHVADCPEPNHLDCPKFQQLLKLATRAQRRAT